MKRDRIYESIDRFKDVMEEDMGLKVVQVNFQNDNVKILDLEDNRLSRLVNWWDFLRDNYQTFKRNR